MIRLLNLFQRVGLLRPTPPAPQPVSPTADDAERVTRLIVERLSEDETLRGALTDAGFAPVLDFVSSLVPAAVERAQRVSTPGVVEDTVSHAARMLARAIAAAAESGDTTVVANALALPIAPADAIERARSVLPMALAAGTSVDERARTITQALSGAIEEPRA